MAGLGLGTPCRALWCSAGLIAAVSLLALTGCTGNTTGASSVTATSATLNAQGTCENSCDVRFRYHVKNGPWTYTPVKNYPSSGSHPPVAVSAAASSLSPASPYSYQACGDDKPNQAEGCVGQANGQPSTFATASSGAPQIGLMTYNVEHFLHAHSSSTNPESGYDQIADDIRASGASIVALQEVRLFSSNEADKIVDALGWNTGGTHAYFQGWQDPQNCTPTPGCNQIGVAIISKYPFATNDPSGWVYLDPHDQGLDRKLIRATIQVGSKQIRVYATWLATNSSGVQYQRDQLHNAVAFITGKLASLGINQAVFMGDFNLPYSADNAANSFDSPNPSESLRVQGYHDWNVDRIPMNNVNNGNICGATDPSIGLSAPCTFSNYDSRYYDKRDYVWVKGYPVTSGRVDCSAKHSDHCPYYTSIIY